MSSVSSTHAPKGLEGIVATNSGICYIDGDRGVLAYRGIDVHELAEHSTFEETCYLLWFGCLPNRSELKNLRERLAQERQLDPAIIRFLREVPRSALPMDVLRTAVSVLAFYDADEKNNDHDANVRKAIRLTSQIAMIVAAYDRIRKDKPLVEADRSLFPRSQFPFATDRFQAVWYCRARSRYRTHLHADHELNASTFLV
jgi:citrate synthase